MPAVKAMREATGYALPIQTVREIQAPVIAIPDIGKAVVDEDEDDWLWLI